MTKQRPLAVTMCAVLCGGLGASTIAYVGTILLEGGLPTPTQYAIVCSFVASCGYLMGAAGMMRMKSWSRRCSLLTAAGGLVVFFTFETLNLIEVVRMGQWGVLSLLPLQFGLFSFQFVVFPLVLIYVLTRPEVKLAFLTTPAVIETGEDIEKLVTKDAVP